MSILPGRFEVGDLVRFDLPEADDVFVVQRKYMPNFPEGPVFYQMGTKEGGSFSGLSDEFFKLVDGDKVPER